MTDNNCIFCKIIKGQIPAAKVYEDPEVMAFRDINPQAPVHMLIVPKKHIACLNDLTREDQGLAGYILLVAGKIARENGLAENGYRVVFNHGKNGGQTVDHIHGHLMGGRAFRWPPG